MKVPGEGLECLAVVSGDVDDLPGLEVVGVDVDAVGLLAGQAQAVSGLE